MAKGISNAKTRQLELEHSTEVPAGSRFFPGSTTAIPEGISIRSRKGVQIDFMYQGIRRTETLRGTPTVAHVLKACEKRRRVNQSIGLGLFIYEDEFPNSRQVANPKNLENIQLVPTIGEALDTWLAVVKNTVGINAHIDYTKDIKGQLKLIPLHVLQIDLAKSGLQQSDFLSTLPADLLTVQGICNLRNWYLEHRGVSVKRLMNILIPLRGTMAMLAEDPHQSAISENPFDRVRPLKRNQILVEPSSLILTNSAGPALSMEQVAQFKEDNVRPDPFTPEEIAAFLPHMSAPIVNLVKFWISTGLRTGELIALQWGDIDLKGGKICIRHAVSRGVYKQPKSGEIRWVKMGPQAKEALQAQFDLGGQTGEYVFPNPFTNRRWADESKICSRFKAALALAGVRYRRPYHCRHTYASTQLSLGESVLFVAEQLGHRNCAMVLRHYARWIPSVDIMAGLRGAVANPIKLSNEGNTPVFSTNATSSTPAGVITPLAHSIDQLGVS